MKKYPKHCVDCDDGLYEVVTVEYKDVDQNGHEVSVPGVEILRCKGCGAELIPAASDRLISEAVAQANEQLTPAELYALMEQYDLNQKEVAKICGFGEKTFHRWLKGTQVVSRSMGYYLRILQEFPAALQFVKDQAWRTGANSTSRMHKPEKRDDVATVRGLDAFPALERRNGNPAILKENPAQLFQHVA